MKAHAGDYMLDMMTVAKAVTFLNEPRFKQDFGYSFLGFLYASHGMLGNAGKSRETAREAVDLMLAASFNKPGKVRKEGSPFRRRHVARLLNYRSFDKLTRGQDKAGAEVDLSLAIKVRKLLPACLPACLPA